MIETRGVELALGAIVLGAVGASFASYALQWQPVPAEWPGAPFGVYASAAILIVGGVATVWSRTAVWGARALAVFFGLWVIVLHGPRVVGKPADVLMWLGFCEILAMASGALMLSAMISGDKRVALAARYLFGVCPLVFGLSHFMYAQFTADMVPAWIPPGQLFWAYATGVGHVAAALAILSGVMARLASGLLTLMFASFALVLHAPRVMAAPDNHAEWVMLGVALTLTGAAFVMWRSFAKKAD